MIDMIYLLNKTLIDAGAIKPTQIVATLQCEATDAVCGFGWSPEWCIREVDA